MHRWWNPVRSGLTRQGKIDDMDYSGDLFFTGWWPSSLA
jgi:hypothetical protein